MNKNKHGESKTRLYNIWKIMKQRCYNIKYTQYKDYGGRGITICNEWKNNFTYFRDWALNNSYADNLTIDRRNTDGNYEPSNCRWVTREENNRNRKCNKIKSLEQANEIRDLYNTGNYTQLQLAIKYNTTRINICEIINNYIWKK